MCIKQKRINKRPNVWVYHPVNTYNILFTACIDVCCRFCEDVSDGSLGHTENEHKKQFPESVL